MPVKILSVNLCSFIIGAKSRGTNSTDKGTPYRFSIGFYRLGSFTLKTGSDSSQIGSMKTLISAILLLIIVAQTSAQGVFSTTSASIAFSSEAPLEIIKATSDQCRGVLNAESGEFAFQVAISSFNGFNNALQKEHFRENYMEAHDFPTAEFRGILLSSLELNSDTLQIVKAKGVLTIHGIEEERIIDVEISQKEDQIEVYSNFEVLLAPYGIEIPRIVYQKIAEEINVTFQGILQ